MTSITIINKTGKSLNYFIGTPEEINRFKEKKINFRGDSGFLQNEKTLSIIILTEKDKDILLI